MGNYPNTSERVGPPLIVWQRPETAPAIFSLSQETMKIAANVLKI